MGTTILGDFDTRRNAEMAVERLVQEIGVERTDIFIAPTGDDNSAGVTASGADTESGHPTENADGDPALGDKIELSIDVEDEALADKVRAALTEFGASNVEEV